MGCWWLKASRSGSESMWDETPILSIVAGAVKMVGNSPPSMDMEFTIGLGFKIQKQTSPDFKEGLEELGKYKRG